MPTENTGSSPDASRRDDGGDTRSTVSELLLVGNLPVRAGVWLAPYADAVARTSGPTALLRLDDDAPVLQVLRAGAYELLARADVPAAAAINEYVDVAKAFFDDREAKFVNGILDAVAKEVR